MKIEIKRIDSLTGYEKNARTHDEQQLRDLQSSIKTFGFTLPIEIDENNIILSGHARVLAAKMCGLTEIPTIVQKHLTGPARRAYIIAANKIALKAGWDMALLKEELATLKDEGFDLGLTGFDESEVNILLDLDADFSPGLADDQGKLDVLEPKWIDCPHCGEQFNAREMI